MSRVYTPAMLAERWGCSPDVVLRMIKSGSLPAFSIGTTGGMWRVNAYDVEAHEAAGLTPKPKAPCSVYVIKTGNCVKIGKAADPDRRIASLQAANPSQIEVLAILADADGHKLERSLHVRFAGQRERGEWFRIEGGLADWIAVGCPL